MESPEALGEVPAVYTDFRIVSGPRRPPWAAMNRFQDDYDPYAVEEPSDEEPALSRWAAAPRCPPGPGRAYGARQDGRAWVLCSGFACRSLGCLVELLRLWGTRMDSSAGRGVFQSPGGPKRESSDGTLPLTVC